MIEGSQQHKFESIVPATRAAPRVAFVTCAELPDLDPDDRTALPVLAELGIAVEPAVWDAPVDWSAYDLVVLRSPWDYATRRAEFLAWTRTVARLANTADVVAWNTDKRYLRELADGGIPIVPTTWIEPDDAWSPPADGVIVIKPAVSAGGLDSGRYELPRDADLAAAHVARLRAAGRTVMVQPYLAGVDTAGETALMFVDGRFSHAIRKGALLTGPDIGVEGLYRQERIDPRRPEAAEAELAEAVLAALPFPATGLLYARVDLLPGPDGSPVLIELELTEPSLFLGTAAGAPQRLARAIADRVGDPAGGPRAVPSTGHVGRDR